MQETVDTEQLLTTVETEQLLTTADAARLANVAGETIRGWANTGKLPAIRTVSGVRLFRRTDVERVMRIRIHSQFEV
jgi:excisionase family DNA binding protein